MKHKASPYGIEPGLYAQAPFFHVRRLNERLRLRGRRHCELGHRIDRGPERSADGIHAWWRWDGERLVAGNDRYGLYPLYYFQKDGEFCLSTSIFKLLEEGAEPEIDWPALAVFWRMGFFPPGDTVFKTIRALPPAAALAWRDGQLQVSGDYHQVGPQTITRQAAVEEYDALFRAAMARRIPEQGDFAVPLSGGRDSRHIVLELCRSGHRPAYCLSARRFPPDPAADQQIAAQVAAALGLRHVIVGPPQGQIKNLFNANVKTSMTAPRRGWKFAIVEQLLATVRATYDGIGGDMLSAGSALDDKQIKLMESGNYEGFLRHIFRDVNTMLGQVMPVDKARLLSDEAALERLIDEPARHAGAANPTTSFYFWNRTRRFDGSNPYGMLADVPTVYLPFLDHDLFDFLASLPVEMIRGNAFHDEVIRRAYPEYADIPFEKKPNPPTYDPAHFRATTRELTAFVLHHRPWRLIKPGFMASRLMQRAATLGFSAGGIWYIPLVVYLTLLDAVAYQGALGAQPDALDWDEAPLRRQPSPA